MLALSIVGLEVLSQDTKENVVLDPFREGADAGCAEDLSTGISNFAIDAGA